MFRTLTKLLLFLATVTLHAQGVITTIAGSDLTYPGSSFSANLATFGQLSGVAVSPSGDVYFASSSRSLIVKFNPQQNSLTIVAGTGIGAYSGDGGPAANASLNSPQQIAFDASGNLYIADQFNDAIRKIDTQGVITTLVTGLEAPPGVAVAPDGSIYAADFNRIMRISSNGSVTVIAGSLQAGYSGDGGPASQALLNDPQGLAFDSAGNLYFSDRNNFRVRRIATDGTISTFAGNGQSGTPVDGQPATSVALSDLNGTAVDAAGNVYITSDVLFGLIDSKGILHILDSARSTFFVTAPGPIRNAFLGVRFMAFDLAGNLYLTDNFANCLYRLSLAGTIQAVAGYAPTFGIGDGGPAQSAGLNSPDGLTLMPDGSLLIADTYNHRIRRISASGTISTVAGTGAPGPTSATALTSSFLNPSFLASDLTGGYWISINSSLFHVTSSGAVSQANIPGLGYSRGLAVDTGGNLFIADQANNQVLSVSPAGKTTVVAGTGAAGFSGDGGPATAASLNFPQGIAMDANGVLYIADINNNRIRKVTPDGTISTLFAHGTAGTHDGFYGIAVDRQGNLYVTAQNTVFVEKISPNGTGVMIADTGQSGRGFGGDGGPATAASFSSPSGIAVDAAGNVFIADSGNNRIREILAAPPSLGVAVTQVSLSAVTQGPPVSASLEVTSSAQGLPYSISFSTASGGDWLGVGSLQGTAPGVLTINADPSQLKPGTYNGAVTLSSSLAAPGTVTISVTLTVGTAQASKLSLNTTSLSFAFTAGNGPASQQLSVSNAGASVNFTASAATTSGGSWLAVSPSTGNASAASPGTLTIAATPGTLPAGTYSGTVTIASAATGDQLIVPVVMAISAAKQIILLSQTGLTFTAVAQGGGVLPQSFGILNAGSGSMNWTAQATTLSGSGWLSIDSASGTVNTPLLDVSFVNVQVNAQSLAAGNYYGSIQVSASGAANSPQTIAVVLNVLAPGSNPGPEVRPTGLVFTGLGGGGNNPGSQSVNVSNVTGAAQLSYGSSPTYVNSSNWLSYLPANATLDPVTPTRIVVQPDFTALSPGIYRGAITLALSDGSIRTVSILSVVAQGTPGAGAENGGLAPRASCSPSQLQMQILNPQQGVGAGLGQPLPLQVEILDNCGTPMTPQRGGAAVAAVFSNGDPGLTMVHTQNGVWNGTWVPRNGTPGAAAQIAMTALLVLQNNQTLVNQIILTGSLASGAGAPVPQSVLNSASFLETGTLAPGALISLFGSGLASAPTSGTNPLPTDLAGTEVTLGGQLLPLLYASDGQVNAQVPYGLAVNTQLQLQVKRGTSLSVPQSVTVAPAQPAIFTVDESGRGQGAIVNLQNQVVDASAPAGSGDTVVMYGTGLGAVTPALPAGVSAPSAPLSQASGVSVTIGGVAANVSFAGLSPGYAGLYQLNVVVPPGVTPGSQVPVAISVAGQTSPPVTMAVK